MARVQKGMIMVGKRNKKILDDETVTTQKAKDGQIRIRLF